MSHSTKSISTSSSAGISSAPILTYLSILDQRGKYRYIVVIIALLLNRNLLLAAIDMRDYGEVIFLATDMRLNNLFPSPEREQRIEEDF